MPVEKNFFWASCFAREKQRCGFCQFKGPGAHGSRRFWPGSRGLSAWAPRSPRRRRETGGRLSAPLAKPFLGLGLCRKANRGAEKREKRREPLHGQNSKRPLRKPTGSRRDPLHIARNRLSAYCEESTLVLALIKIAQG